MSYALETVGLEKRFGGLTATNKVSLRLQPGVRQALIGPNGAGKTTLVNQLSGVLAPTSGKILLEGRDITGVAAHKRVGLGLTRTFQITQLFGALTPLETVCLAVLQRRGFGARMFGRVGRHAEVTEEAAALLESFGLTDVMERETRLLAYGRQRLLEIAVALAARPRVLLMDEPAAGVPEDERREVLSIIAALPRDVTILLIEHDMDLVFAFAERISVLVGGALLTEGTVAEVAADPRVREAYLGEGSHD
jgi:branched-chain amino acid transport system ATP-binding protein